MRERLTKKQLQEIKQKREKIVKNKRIIKK
jgi:hypothetical protein